METSRALSRCLQQLSVHNQSCLRTNTAAAAHRLRSQRNSSRQSSKLPSSSRTFHSSRSNYEDRPSPSNPQDARSTSQSQSPPSQQPRTQQSPLPSSNPDSNRNRISLSSLVSDPGYVPPPRRMRTQTDQQQSSTDPQKAARAKTIGEQLDSLVAGERARIANTAGRSPVRRTSTNYMDQYGPDSDIFKRTRDPTQPSSRGVPSSPSAMAERIRDMVSGTRDPYDQAILDAKKEADRARDQLRLHPSLGKTVDVNESAGFGVTRAFITLEAKINGRGNAVRKEEREQKFHVRRGQKKKLERRERWRVTFREGFLGECARVRKMIRQGW